MQYIVIGSSRGLGASMVEELLQRGHQVTGIARTGLDQIKNSTRWSQGGLYQHIQLDITSPESGPVLQKLSSEFDDLPICIIYNSAIVKSDFKNDILIDYDIWDQVNRVQIDGFVNVIKAFESRFLKYGGKLVGISSFSACAPPVFEPRVGYPASKAYLNMVLRCLRQAWKEKVQVLTVHLGHMQEKEESKLPEWLAPLYSRAGKKIIDSVVKNKIPANIHFPLVYYWVYGLLLPLLPDSLYEVSFKILRKVIGSKS